MRTLFISICFIFLIACQTNNGPNAPLMVSHQNPGYFEYKGKPVIIVGATEHYFSVVNLKFDYNIYLNRLHSLGFNMATIKSGVFLEPSGQGEWEELVIPWKRSREEGYQYGGNKFDLSEWDEAYFDRLEKFVSTAYSKDIIVKYIFFTPFYDDHKWSATAFNPANNVNSIYGQIQPNGIYTLDMHQGLLDLQKGLIDRVTDRLKAYPNVIYEVTYDGGREWTDYEWYRHIFTYLYEQMPEPKKPVLFNVGGLRAPVVDIFPEASGISYMFADDKQLVHVMGKGLPVVHGESSFRPNWEPHVRHHAYRSLLSGVGAYTFADFGFNARFPDGIRTPSPRALHGGGPEIHNSLAAVSKVMNSIDFINMTPNHSLASFKNSEFEAAALANEGNEYLVYICPAPASVSYKVVFKGFIKPIATGWQTVKAHANGTLRFIMEGKELINSPVYENQSITKNFYYDGIKPIPFELESKFSYYPHETRLILGADTINGEAITYEQLLTTDAVTPGVEATYYTGINLDEKQIWRIEKRAHHRGISSPFFKEDQVFYTHFTFSLPSGKYHCQWLDAKTAQVINEFNIEHQSGEYRFSTPGFAYDILLLIKRIEH